jgi:hypothetical protein
MDEAAAEFEADDASRQARHIMGPSASLARRLLPLLLATAAPTKALTTGGRGPAAPRQLPQLPTLWAPVHLAQFLHHNKFDAAAAAVMASVRIGSFDELDGPAFLDGDGDALAKRLSVPLETIVELQAGLRAQEERADEQRVGGRTASPKKSSPKTALNRKTLHREYIYHRKYPFLTADWLKPHNVGASPIESSGSGWAAGLTQRVPGDVPQDPFAPPDALRTPSPHPLKSTKTLLGPPDVGLWDLSLSGSYHPRMWVAPPRDFVRWAGAGPAGILFRGAIPAALRDRPPAAAACKKPSWWRIGSQARCGR